MTIPAPSGVDPWLWAFADLVTQIQQLQAAGTTPTPGQVSAIASAIAAAVKVSGAAVNAPVVTPV